MFNFTIIVTIIALLSIATLYSLAKKVNVFLTNVGTVLLIVTGFTSCVGIVCWVMLFLIAILF